MKTITINLAAAWGAGVSSWQDGDVFRESNTDTWTTSISDRLGYLKTQADASVLTSGNQSVAGNKTFSGTTTLSGPVTISGAPLVVSSSSFQISSTETSITGELTLQSLLNLDSGAVLAVSSETLADSDTTFDLAKVVHILPNPSGNRIYTLPSGNTGQLAFIKKTATGGAFTVTIKDSVGSPNTLGIISSNSQGWILAQCVGTVTWRTLFWGGTVTSILA